MSCLLIFLSSSSLSPFYVLYIFFVPHMYVWLGFSSAWWWRQKNNWIEDSSSPSSAGPPGIISLDQAGFMLGRYSFHNTRRLLNILNMPSSTTPEVVVSLDAEKAFGQVESGFLCSFCANKWLVFTPFSTPPWHMAGMSTVPLIVCHSHWASGYLAKIWGEIWGRSASGIHTEIITVCWRLVTVCIQLSL